VGSRDAPTQILEILSNMTPRISGRETWDITDSDTLMAARPQPNDGWGSVGKMTRSTVDELSLYYIMGITPTQFRHRTPQQYIPEVRQLNPSIPQHIWKVPPPPPKLSLSTSNVENGATRHTLLILPLLFS